MNKEEYLTQRSLQSKRSVIIKPAYKALTVVAWDRHNYLKETERQFNNNTICKEAKFTEKELLYFVDKSNNNFANLERKILFRRKRRTILNLILEELQMLEHFTHNLTFIKI